MKSSRVLSISILVAVITLLSWGHYIFKTYYPFVNSIVEQVIPTDKKLYSPGDTVEFHMKGCYDGIKYSEVTYQLESERNGKLYYLVLDSVKSVSREGCFDLVDLNARIPADFFERDSTHPGKHRLYIIVTDYQNTSKPLQVYQTDWFYIEN